MNEKNRQLSQEVKAEESCKEIQFEDIDKENLNDPHLVSLYAFHIFNYYKEREVRYSSGFTRQEPNLLPWFNLDVDSLIPDENCILMSRYVLDNRKPIDLVCVTL